MKVEVSNRQLYQEQRRLKCSKVLCARVAHHNDAGDMWDGSILSSFVSREVNS